MVTPRSMTTQDDHPTYHGNPGWLPHEPWQRRMCHPTYHDNAECVTTRIMATQNVSLHVPWQRSICHYTYHDNAECVTTLVMTMQDVSPQEPEKHKCSLIIIMGDNLGLKTFCFCGETIVWNSMAATQN